MSEASDETTANASRLEVGARGADPVAAAALARLRAAVPEAKLHALRLVDVYTVAPALDDDDRARLASLLAHPVTHEAAPAPLVRAGFDVALEVALRPGVTDNVARTVADMLAAAGRTPPDGESVHSSRLFLLSGEGLDERALGRLGAALANPLIEHVSWLRADDYARAGGMPIYVPRVHLRPHPRADLVPLRAMDDDELARVGRGGVAEPDGRPQGPGIPRRGPLALDLPSMRAIRDFFVAQGRDPTDVELECLAQNWSEHCRHLLFNSPIGGDALGFVEEGLFKGYIRRATEAIRAARGESDPCVSVFVDNAGAVAFDDEWLVTDKVETHNSPSALDPFGGALTGILGVNRDALGFGLGARPILNRYGFCLPFAQDTEPLFRAPGADPLLAPLRLAEGIFHGVEVGGNCSGIPTPQGFWRFHAGYRGKPLVFVGTVGLLPRASAGRRLHEKRARPGDRVVVAGGRVGKDGIHGATFSSEALAAGSPATAVQIGDPIGQKRLADVLLDVLRDRALYTSLTDNGAGGLSCSVTEMAREAGGCDVDLARVPLKYPGLSPWEIWVSEAQERMTLAVPPEHVDAVVSRFAAWGVEAVDLGAFTATGRAVVRVGGDFVLDLPLDFVHDGFPRPRLRVEAPPPVAEAPDPARPATAAAIAETLAALLSHPNVATHAPLVRRFDHEVQGATVLKPMVGGVCADATAVRPLLGERWTSRRAVAVAEALAPELSELDGYAMAAFCVDLAVRRVVAAGADLEAVALLDNFCWSSPLRADRLFLLREACRACHDVAVALGTPFISGKDSMHNDFRGYDAAGTAVHVPAPPTLLVSSLAVVPDVDHLVSFELKAAGDLLVLVGATSSEMGGSAYRTLRGLGGGAVPRLDPARLRTTCGVHAALAREGLLASSIALGQGGLLVAAARAALGGGLGAWLSLRGLEEDGLAEGHAPARAGLFGRDDRPAERPHLDDAAWCFAETPGRFLLSCAPRDATTIVERFGAAGVPVAILGHATAAPALLLEIRRGEDVRLPLAALRAAYETDWRAR